MGAKTAYFRTERRHAEAVERFGGMGAAIGGWLSAKRPSGSLI
jgi:hypothetical protein